MKWLRKLVLKVLKLKGYEQLEAELWQAKLDLKYAKAQLEVEKLKSKKVIN